MLIIELQRNRLIYFLNMHYFYPFAVEAETAVFMLQGLLLHGAIEDTELEWDEMEMYPKLSDLVA